MNTTADIKKLPRKFFPENLILSDWETIEPFFKELLERKIHSKEDLEKWLQDMSELEAMMNEDACWRQIKMTCDTNNKTTGRIFQFFLHGNSAKDSALCR